MGIITFENQKTVKSLISNVNAYAQILDNDLDMQTEAGILRDISKDMSRGIFKILFMGKFNNGKSTIINALIGKVIMHRRATACTAVIATVEYGKDINSVRIVYSSKSKRPPKIISVEQFAKEFSISAEEEKKLAAEGGRLDCFADVSHAEMQSTNEILNGGTRLIDSPGLEENVTRTIVTNQFLPKANAVIFMLNAVSLFSAKEKEYISDNFADKHMTNLFFVVNRVNQLTPGQFDEVKADVELGLTDVFKNADGEFDRELYNRRVFFVDAYGAECVRTGEPYKIKIGKKEIEVSVTLEETGFMEFETELRSFLNSSERMDALINSTLSVMTASRETARKKVQLAEELRTANKQRREQRLQEAQQGISDAKTLLTKIPRTINNFADETASKIYSYIEFSVEYIGGSFADKHARRFFDYLSSPYVWSSIASLLVGSTIRGIPLIGKRFVSEDDLKTAAQPIIDFFERVIKQDFEEAMARIPAVIPFSDMLKTLEDALEKQVAQFDLNIKKAANIENSLHAALAMSNWEINFSAASQRLPEKLPVNFQWLDSIVSAVSATIVLIVSGLWLVITPITMPLIVISALGYCISEGMGPSELKRKLFSIIVEKIFIELKDYVQKEEINIKRNVRESIVALMSVRGEQLSMIAQNIISDSERWLKKFENEDATDTEASARDKARLKKLNAQLEKSAATLYRK